MNYLEISRLRMPVSGIQTIALLYEEDPLFSGKSEETEVLDGAIQRGLAIESPFYYATGMDGGMRSIYGNK